MRTGVRAQHLMGRMIPRSALSGMRMFYGEVMCIRAIDDEMPRNAVNADK
jgi:hypothetical protein